MQAEYLVKLHIAPGMNALEMIMQHPISWLLGVLILSAAALYLGIMRWDYSCRKDDGIFVLSDPSNDSVLEEPYDEH